MASVDNLKEAFAGESQANRKYLAFATKAEADGFPQVARFFRAVAEAETVHAHAHLRALAGVKSTVENLQAAIEGESYEFQSMYPKFVAEAEREGHQAALASFRNAQAVEKVHYDLYTAALRAVQAGKDLPAAPIRICAICGHTVVGDAPERCPVCGAAREKFTEIR